MPWGLLGTGLALAGTGVTVIQAANSGFWSALGWTFMVLGLVIVLLAGVAFFRRRRGHSEKPANKQPRPKVGILNVGKGSESRSFGSTFGSRLDSGIENREGGYAEDTGSTFAGDDEPEEPSHRPRRSLIQRIRSWFWRRPVRHRRKPRG